MTERGVIYYATGEKYVEQTLDSAESLKGHTDVPITVYTDIPDIDSPHIDDVVTISPSESPFYDRIDYFKQTPYEKTVHLDTDTYVADTIEPIFTMLDRFDVVAAFDEFRDTAVEHHGYKEIDIDAPDSFPEYQCGVIGYRNTDAVQRFLTDWQNRYEPYKNENVLDQPHFREAAYHNQIAFGTLPSEYNVRINYGGFLYQTVKIIHYAGAENRPFIGTEVPDAEIGRRLADTLNENAPQSRAFIVEPDGLRVESTLVHPSDPLARRILQHISEEGLWQTFRRGVEKLVYE